MNNKYYEEHYKARIEDYHKYCTVSLVDENQECWEGTIQKEEEIRFVLCKKVLKTRISQLEDYCSRIIKSNGKSMLENFNNHYDFLYDKKFTGECDEEKSDERRYEVLCKYCIHTTESNGETVLKNFFENSYVPLLKYPKERMVLIEKLKLNNIGFFKYLSGKAEYKKFMKDHVNMNVLTYYGLSKYKADYELLKALSETTFIKEAYDKYLKQKRG